MLVDGVSSSELRYRRLFEAAHDGILIVDPETRMIVDVNPFLVKFLGYTREEFIGKELFQLGVLRDEAANRTAFKELREVGYIRYENLPLQTKTGAHVDVEFVSNLYTEGDHQIIQCNVRDITARRMIERQLQEARAELASHAAELESVVRIRTAELRLSNSQLETFVFSIAHDLRAPLRAMQGFCQLLVEEHAPNLNQQGREYAQFVADAAKQMDRQLTDLLVFSHVSQQTIELVPVALADAVSSALAGCDAEIRSSHARVENVPPWPVVMAHASTLRQVLVNLIGNAIKFVAARIPHLVLRAEIRPQGTVRVWVEDNGIGIPAKYHDRIFQVFQRLHTHAYSGTGIGLAIVQKGVERMDGRAGVASTPGEGSQFWIELNQAPPGAIAAPAPALR